MLRAFSLGLAISVSAVAAPKLAVVDVATPPTLLGLGAQVTRALVSSAQQQGYQVVEPDQVRDAVGAETYAQLQACAGQPTCVINRLGALKVNRIVTGSVARDEKSYLLKLFLIDVDARQVIADVDRVIPIASRRFSQDATAAIPGLLRGEHEARGTLKVSSKVRNINVTVDGALAGRTPLSIELKPGKHELSFDKKKYLPETRWVTVEPNQVTEEDVRMILAPGEVPDEEPTQVASASAPVEHGQSFRIPALGWIGVSGGVVLGGGAIYFGSAMRNLQLKLTQGYDPVADRYAGTRADVLTGKRDARIANILFAASGAALITGVVFTVLENTSSPAAKVTLAPLPGGATALLEGRF